MVKSSEEMRKALCVISPIIGHPITSLFFTNFIHRHGEDSFAIWDDKGNANANLFRDIEGLYSLGPDYVIYHREHEKFGRDVIEVGNTYIKNNGGCFFDWEKLSQLYKIYKLDDTTLEIPHVPFYYALPEDRYDFKSGYAKWIEDENS